MEPLGDASRAHVARELQARYGIRLPGPSLHKQHERFHHKTHFPELRASPGDWVSSFEVGGAVPCFLWLTNQLDAEAGNACCVLIEQRLRFERSERSGLPRMNLVRLNFHPRVFCDGGSVIQGDIVHMNGNSSNKIFLATDLWAEGGEPLVPTVPFGDRLLRLQHLANAAHTPNLVGDVLTLRVRPYFAVSQLHGIVRMRLPLDYGSGCIGILFRSIHHGSRSVLRMFPHASAATAATATEEPDKVDEYDADDDDDECGELYDNDNDDETTTSTMFYVVSTCVPDVFELKHSLSDATVVDIAGVPSLRDSQALRRAAESGTPLAFQRRMRFQNKWVWADAADPDPDPYPDPYPEP
jgi:hypothetical protein